MPSPSSAAGANSKRLRPTYVSTAGITPPPSSPPMSPTTILTPTEPTLALPPRLLSPSALPPRLLPPQSRAGLPSTRNLLKTLEMLAHIPLFAGFFGLGFLKSLKSSRLGSWLGIAGLRIGSKMPLLSFSIVIRRPQR